MVQKLTGLLNFLQKAIVPRRTYTRRMYDKLRLTDNAGNLLKQYHHIKVDDGFRDDCRMWLSFLTSQGNNYIQLCHPFIDFMAPSLTAEELDFYTDSSLCKTLGFGCIFSDRWFAGLWGADFIDNEKPSIEFLELFALCAAVLTWEHLLQNCRVIIYCDNEAVVNIVNNMTSKCTKCMKLVRMLIKDGMLNNRRIFVKHVRSEANVRADMLSRCQFDRFWRNSKSTTFKKPNQISEQVWPIDKIRFD